MSSLSDNSEIIFSPGRGTSQIKEIKEDVLKEKENLESDWDRDPENARNWPTRRKWMTFSAVWLYVLLQYFCTEMISPGLPEIVEKYHIRNPSVIGMPFTVYLLSSYLGSLFLSPLSELYGRTWVLHITAILSVVFNLACAFSPNFSALVTFRLLAGFSGGAPPPIGVGIISDMFVEGGRTLPTTLFAIAPGLSIISPIIGGAITQSAGIKWVFITVAISFASACIIGSLLLRETYGPVIRHRQALRNVDPEAIITIPVLDRSRKNLSILWVTMKRPVVLLCRSSVCLPLGLYPAMLIGFAVLLTTQIAKIFQQTYGFQPRDIGLVSLGPACGILIALLVSPKLVDHIHKMLSEKNEGRSTPEMRMLPMFFAALFFPAGLLLFGWSVQTKLHWMMPIVGLGLMQFTLNSSGIVIDLYLMDVFGTYSTSAIAAVSILSAIPELVFPLFGAQMYNKLGLGAGSTLLAGLAVVLVLPIPLYLYYNGEALRARSQFIYC